MNKVILMGRQTAEAKISYTASGMCVARFNTAIDRIGKDKGADFPSIVAFDKTAEFIEKYGSKGMKWVIEGHLQTGSYEKDGHKVYTTDVIADRVEFAESKASKETAPAGDDFVKVPDSVDEETPFF